MGNSKVEIRVLPGWPGYLVGSDGSVWTVWRAYAKPRPSVGVEPRLMRQTTHAKDGYKSVTLNLLGGGSKRRAVHCLVLEAFVGPRPLKMQGCHGDGNPANNQLSNLRWDTVGANHLDAIRHGTAPHGMKHKKAKLTDEIVANARIRYEGGEGIASLARELGVSSQSMGSALRRKTWKHVP